MTERIDKNIKHFIKRLCLYLLLLFFTWVVVIAICANLGEPWREYLRRYSNIPIDLQKLGDSSILRFQEIFDYNDVDILFIGSSHCYRSFDTRVFARYGLYTFNMGSTSQTPLNAYYLLQNHLEHLNPELLVIEVYPRMLQNTGLESFLDLSTNMPISVDILKMAIAVADVRSIHGMMIRLFEINRIPLDKIEPNYPEGDKYIPGGFVEKDDEFEGVRNVSPDIERIISPSQFGYLSDIIKMAHDRSSSVLLVIQPLPKEHLKVIINYDEVQGELAEFARLENVKIIDFNNIISFDTYQDFYDSDHLKQNAVEYFDSLFVKVLVDSGYIELPQ